MMYDHFEINVSLNGKHFFATHMRSCRTEGEKDRVLNVLKEKFPTSEGYLISVTKWVIRGQQEEV